MRAKIQFTVEIENIPEEVLTRLTSIYGKSETVSSEIKEVMKEISENNILVATKKIDDIRRDLSFYDSVLEDSYNVLVAYASYQTKQLEKNIQQESREANE